MTSVNILGSDKTKECPLQIYHIQGLPSLFFICLHKKHSYCLHATQVIREEDIYVRSQLI